MNGRRPLRVLLVSLPFHYFPFGSRRANYVRPPLGIIQLAAYLRDRAQDPVEARCLDLLTEPGRSPEEVLGRILGEQADVVGFSVLTATQPIAEWLCSQIRQLRPETKLVVGGPHVTVLPDEPRPWVDAAILGEGEATLLAYIEEGVLGGSREPIAGAIRYLPDGEPLVGPVRPPLPDLDSLPFAARDLLPADAYYHLLPYRGVTRFTTHMTGRGCPYDCNFCGNDAIWGRRVRMQSVARVLAEVDHIVRHHGANLIFFEDDTFSARRERVLELCEGLARAHPGLRWICHTRVDCVDDELVRTMRRAGCVEAQIGAESGDPDVLRSTGKGVVLEQVRSAMALFRKHRINTWATFVLGHEQETRATLERTLQYAVELNPTYASFIVLLPFPGTAVYERFRELGYLDTDRWEDFTWYGRPVFHTAHLTPEDLMSARSRANLRFYLRPSKLAELAWMTLRGGSVREMLRNVAAWRSVVTPRR
ncbi:MAG: radical SAM protein [bacterium]